MGKWFAPITFRHSDGLDRTKRPLVWLLLLFNKNKRDNLQIQTHSEMSGFATATRPVPHSEEFPVSKPAENPTFSDDTLILMEIVDSMKWTMSIPIRHLKQVVPHLNSIY